MKIVAIDNNYGKDAGEGQNPAWFLLTHSCLLRDNRPLYLPDWDDDFRLYPSMAIRIDRLGKSIPERFGHRYWNHYSFGFSLRGNTTLRNLRERSLPEGEALAFDNSAVIAGWHEADRDKLEGMSFCVSSGGETVSRWDYASLALKADALLAHVSRRMTFKTGDILFLGFPDEGIRVSRGLKIIVNETIMNAEDTISTEFSGFTIK